MKDLSWKCALPWLLLQLSACAGGRWTSLHDGEVPFGARDLRKDRAPFLRELSRSPSPVCREILRQHLYDANPGIRQEAFRLLNDLKDPPTLLERHMLAHPELQGYSKENHQAVDSFIAAIHDLPTLEATAYHALVKIYRPELCHVSFYDAQKRIADPRRFDPGNYSFKDARSEGGMEGILSKDRVSFRKQDGIGKGTIYRSISDRDISESGIDSRLHRERPMPGAWVRTFPNLACPPTTHNGRFYMADGEGALICGDVSSCQIFWKVPFPIPPYAVLSADDHDLRVRFECSLDAYLFCRFDPTGGNLTGAWIEPRPSHPLLPSLQWKGGTLSTRKDEKSWKILGHVRGKAAWEKSVDCEIRQMRVEGSRLYLLGWWFGSYYSLAALHAATGEAIWSLPVEASGPSLQLCAIDGQYLWLLDDDSWLLCLDKETGRNTAELRLSDSQLCLPVTGLSWDRPTDRIVVDPSNGALYSLPREKFISQHALTTPVRRTMDFEKAFCLKIDVAALDIDIPENKKGNEPGEPDESNPALFRRFANRWEESRFSILGVEGWNDTRTKYAEALILEARREKLDDRELRGCLEAITPDKDDRRAVVPVNAYRLRCGGRDAWVIVCKWELSNVLNACLSHVCMWAVDARTRKILGFATCG